MEIIDLFAGSGGFSLGFKMAKYNVPLAVEMDEWAGLTYQKNHKGTKVVMKDITRLEPPKACEGIDGIIGGPPCQGFSLSGKRDPKDPRNSLFMEFVRFVDQCKPKFFMMENVPGILSMKTADKHNVAEIINKEFTNIGYNVETLKLNSADYGVPQTRNRVFFIGLDKKIPFKRKELRPLPTVRKHISIEEALSDLPLIQAREGHEPMEYTTGPKNGYQEIMRKGSREVWNHVSIKHTKRMVERFHDIKEGGSMKDADKKHHPRKKGNPSVISGKIFGQNNRRPYRNKPSPTITAGFQGSFIHPWIDRNYTVREGARLQSFPDRYRFYGKRSTMSWEKNLSQYQQVGNAVPPLMARALAANMKTYIKLHTSE